MFPGGAKELQTFAEILFIREVLAPQGELPVPVRGYVSNAAVDNPITILEFRLANKIILGSVTVVGEIVCPRVAAIDDNF